MELNSSIVLPRFCKPITTKNSADSTAADVDWNSLKLIDLSTGTGAGTGTGADGLPVVKKNTKKLTTTTATAAALPEPEAGGKGIWKVTEVGISPSFVNGADCVVAFVWSPSKFTLTASVDIPKIRRLSKDMKYYCETAFPLVRVPALDEIIFAPFDGEYFRGCVENVNETRGEVTVLFVDYGDRATVRLLECREPSGKIMTENPVFGMIFTLNVNALVPSQLDLSDDIDKIIDESSLYLQICCCHSQDIRSDTKLGWMGSLCMDVEGKTTLNSVIQKYVLSTTSGSGSVSGPADAQKLDEKLKETTTGESTGGTSAQAADQSIALPSVPVPAPAPAPSLVLLAEAESNQPKDMQPVAIQSPVPVKPIKEPTAKISKIRIRKLFQNSKYSENLIKITEDTITVNYMWGDGKEKQISISSTEDKGDLDRLEELIAEYSETAPGMRRIPVRNEIVIAPYSEIECFYRGRVTAVNGDQVRVTFVDYGDEVEVNYSELKELSLDIAQMPIYGLILQNTAAASDSGHIAVNMRDVQAALGLEPKSTGQMDSKESIVPPSTPTPATVPEAKKSSNRTTFYDLKLSGNLKHGAIVRINCFWNDGLVSVYALQDKAAMQSLDELIDQDLEIGAAQSLLRKPDVDEILLTPYDGSHYRGRVIAVTGDTVKLTFVDYGDEVKVNYTELKELTPPIAKHPVYSVKFRMAGVLETKHISENNPELNAALNSIGQIEVTKIKYMGPTPDVVEELVGNLWLAKDRTWSDIVLGLKKGSSKLGE